MKRGWLEIYGLAVCFFVAAYFLFVAAEAAWHVIQISAPEFTVSSHQWERHQTDEAFRESLLGRHDNGLEKSSYVPPEGEALTKARQDSLELTVRSEARTAVQQLIRNLLGLSIAVVLFLTHWRIARRARAT